MTTSAFESDEPTNKRRLIWDDVKDRLNPSERDEVANIVGNSKLDRNQDVLQEIEALEGILDDYRAFNDKKMATPRLAETPAKRLLEQEIQFLVDRVKTKTATRTDDVLASLRPKTPREADTYDRLVTPESLVPARTPRPGSSHAGSRPGSGASSVLGGRVRPGSACSSSISTFSGRSAGEGLLEVVEESLNVFDIETVLANVRSALDEEYDSLLQEVEFLRISLEDERDYEVKVTAPPPTIDDMRTVKTHLEVQCKYLEGEAKVEKAIARAQQAKVPATSSGITSPRSPRDPPVPHPPRSPLATKQSSKLSPPEGRSRLRALRGLPGSSSLPSLPLNALSGEVPPSPQAIGSSQSTAPSPSHKVPSRPEPVVP